MKNDVLKGISSDSKRSEEAVKQYALGLQKLDLELIAFLLHPQFKFVYRIGQGAGHGLTTDIRFIGHLFKTFTSMKNEGLSIKTRFCSIFIEDVRYLGIKLLPPHDRRIIFPLLDQEVIPSFRNRTPESEMILTLRIRNEQIYKIECYTPSEFDYMIGGRILPYKE